VESRQTASITRIAIRQNARDAEDDSLSVCSVAVASSMTKAKPREVQTDTSPFSYLGYGGLQATPRFLVSCGLL